MRLYAWFGTDSGFQRSNFEIEIIFRKMYFSDWESDSLAICKFIYERSTNKYYAKVCLKYLLVRKQRGKRIDAKRGAKVRGKSVGDVVGVKRVQSRELVSHFRTSRVWKMKYERLTRKAGSEGMNAWRRHTPTKANANIEKTGCGAQKRSVTHSLLVSHRLPGARSSKELH